MGNTIFMGFGGGPSVTHPTYHPTWIHLGRSITPDLWGHRRISPWACCRTGWRWQWNHPRGWSPTCFAPTFPLRTQTWLRSCEKCKAWREWHGKTDDKHGNTGFFYIFFWRFLTFLVTDWCWTCFGCIFGTCGPIMSNLPVRKNGSTQQATVMHLAKPSARCSLACASSTLWSRLGWLGWLGWLGDVGLQRQGRVPNLTNLLVSGALQLRTAGLEHPLSAPRPTFFSIPQCNCQLINEPRLWIAGLPPNWIKIMINYE